jgi:hypothetical protein
MKNIIGIDPGKAGAIIVMRASGKIITQKMPETPTEVLKFLRLHSVNSVCFIEQLHGMPGMSGTAMFTFGKGYGEIGMALLALKIPAIYVTAQKWQKEYGLGTKGKDTTTVWKNKLKAKAEQLFPNVKITLSTADAMLIAEFGRRNYR